VNKLSVSLPWDYLSDTIKTEEADIIRSRIGPNTEFLQMLKDSGVTAVELRHRYKGISLEEMVRAVSVIKDSELSLSIHGENLIEPDSFKFTEQFPWYEIVNELFDNEKIIVTFHPFIRAEPGKNLSEITVEIFRTLLEQKDFPPYIYALENQRSKGYEDPGISFSGIVEMVEPLPEDQTGICWDMGHSYSNTVNFDHPLFPSDDFLARVIQTHIHDLGPGGRTHWPFKENKVPLSENIKLLQSFNYRGAYNLELSFDRFSEEKEITSLVLNSVKKLKTLTE